MKGLSLSARGRIYFENRHLRRSARDVFDHRQRVADADDHLDVQVGLARLRGGQILVVGAAVDQLDGEVLRRDAEALLEQLEVQVDGRLVEEAAEADAAAGLRVGRVVADAVQLLDAGRRDQGPARGIDWHGRRSLRRGRRRRAFAGREAGDAAGGGGLAKVGGRGDQLDVAGEVVRDGVLRGAQLGGGAAGVVGEAGVEQLVGGAHGRGEVDGTGGAVDVGDAGALQPGDDVGVVDDGEEGLHVVMIQPLAIVRAAGGRHGAQLVLQLIEILLDEADGQRDRGRGIGLLDKGPSAGDGGQSLVDDGERGQGELAQQAEAEKHDATMIWQGDYQLPSRAGEMGRESAGGCPDDLIYTMTEYSVRRSRAAAPSDVTIVPKAGQQSAISNQLL